MSEDLNLRIARLMDERGLKPYPFAMSIGVKSSTMTSIYKGKVQFEKISIGNFLKIAHGLGMTAEQLYYGEDTTVDGNPSDGLTQDERRIVDGYRSLDAKAQRRVRRNVKNELEDMEDEAQEKKEVI